jgi:hypothetical protein
MRSGEDANEFSLNVQRYRNLGQRGFVASNVVRIFPHIWRVAHLACVKAFVIAGAGWHRRIRSRLPDRRRV